MKTTNADRRIAQITPDALAALVYYCLLGVFFYTTGLILLAGLLIVIAAILWETRRLD